ncbi:MAG: hypothetical protein DWQ31_12920 [Planctomycetota bacterium]|nr:MAG: hypothetical protein DWQ31_12920 [Planctomycetota bacterium]REJ89406.1 MAG: hypothetical protein DWQ35_18160 [Planctomycetota bacterium]REK26204.1 MAG: hypothetical protein DWQ42_09755 [Planctomycetota bacterium]REK44536.1 MAG: hypothetical protein DWQ46_09780 [Planctomycetota bacterium]
MATAVDDSAVKQIGETAGEVWQLLDASGPLSMTQLIKQIDAPRDTVMQALGWLAREDKVHIEEEGRKKTVELV